MAISKQVVVDLIEIARDGSIGVRFAKQIIDDDGELLGSQPHRVLLTPGDDLDSVMAKVNSHLPLLKFPPVAKEEYQQLSAYLQTKWTPEIVAAALERKEAALKSLVSGLVKPK
jgi:hypothetical protein